MRNILRADYNSVELAWKDLSDKIQQREEAGEVPYNEVEKKLFLDLSFTMFTIEERCRILTQELDGFTGFKVVQ